MTKLQLEKIHRQIDALRAETAKISAEASWYPLVVIAGLFAVAFGVVKFSTDVMAQRKKPSPITPTATWYVLGDIEKALAEQAKSGKPMEWHQAKAYSVVLERLRADEQIVAALALYDTPSEWDTPQKQFQIGYHLRLAQELAPQEKQYLVAAEVARAWSGTLGESVTDNSVINYASRFRTAIEHRLSMMDGNVAYSGLTREEMLKRELADWHPLPPK